MQSDRPTASISRLGLYLGLTRPVFACAAALGAGVLAFCYGLSMGGMLEPLTIALLIGLVSGLLALAAPAAMASSDAKVMATGILGWLAVRPMVGLGLGLLVGFAMAEPARRTMWVALAVAQLIFLAVEAASLIRFSQRALAVRVEVSGR